jgi:hypothetical protein
VAFAADKHRKNAEAAGGLHNTIEDIELTSGELLGMHLDRADHAVESHP